MRKLLLVRKTLQACCTSMSGIAFSLLTWGDLSYKLYFKWGRMAHCYFDTATITPAVLMSSGVLVNIQTSSSFIYEENNNDRQLLATAQNLDDFRKVCFNVKDKYLPFHEGKINFEEDNHITRAGYNLLLPPWICQPYVRMSPEEYTQKMEMLNKPQDSCERKRNHEDLQGNVISRKKMKKLCRIMRRPMKSKQTNGRSGEICVNSSCPNPLGGKCEYQLCKKCCKNKCYEEDLDCKGHRILVHTRRKMAIKFQNENKLVKLHIN